MDEIKGRTKKVRTDTDAVWAQKKKPGRISTAKDAEDDRVAPGEEEDVA